MTRTRQPWALDWIIENFPPSNLSTKDYLWLAQYWQAKNEAQKMLEVLDCAQKLPVAAVTDPGD